MSIAPSLIDVSRSQVTMRRFAHAVDKLRDIEARAELAFQELFAAQEEAAGIGVQVDIVLNPGMAAAYSAWKQARLVDAAHVIAHDEMAPHAAPEPEAA